jgi:hypothetical protein
MAAAAGSIPVFPTCSFVKSGALYTLYSAQRSSWSSGSSELSDRLCLRVPLLKMPNSRAPNSREHTPGITVSYFVRFVSVPVI